ncbi:MAG TPA: DUF2911 domain-containing protein [Roseivirga sp.]
MKKTFTFLIAISLSLACSTKTKDTKNEDSHQHEAPAQSSPAQSKSPAMQAMSNIGNVHVHIEYHAPSVRGRQVFGGLVAYDEVWVTGAHSATSIDFSGDVKLNGQKVEKGKYALFTIPGEDQWTIIINRNFEQHLADDYDQNLDVVRLNVAAQKLTEVQEQLKYEVKELSNGKGIITISWADVSVEFNIEEQ